MAIKVCDAIMGTGKALTLDSDIITGSGIVKMANIKVGDMVYGEDGNLHRVLGVYPQGLKDVYKVTFSDGSSVECCEDHLWSYYTFDEEYNRSELVTESLKDIMSKHVVFRNKWGNPEPYVMRYIPVTKPVYSDEDDFNWKIDQLEIFRKKHKGVIRYGMLNVEVTNASRKDVKRLTGIVQSLGCTARVIDGGMFLDKKILIVCVPQGKVYNRLVELDHDFWFTYSAMVNPERYFYDITYVGQKRCQCIYVDNESHLFLTNEYIVTHNTSASITYLNEHKDEKFIYITPYLDEAERIKKSCPALNFIEPSDKMPEFNYRKSDHTAALIKQGRNITTTHQSFKRYTNETLADIKEQGYSLIIDENVDVLELCDFHEDDLKMVLDAGYITESNNTYSLVNHDYNGTALKDMFSLLRSRELIKFKEEKSKYLYYWALPPELLTSFKDVYILTYLFEGQSLHHFMKIYDIPYEYIGIEKTEDGGFRFGEYPGYTPEYVYTLKDRLHILDKDKLNQIGDDHYALSMNWFKKESNKNKVTQLKNNVYNIINNVWGDIPANRKLWGSYCGESSKIRGKGYGNSFLAFNAKATNNYRNRDYAAYVANLFMNVGEKKYYQSHGIEVDEDMYALSIMVQWIWRSAIREGNEVYLYIPSKRMRTLLINWIDEISKGGNTVHEQKV